MFAGAEMLTGVTAGNPTFNQSPPLYARDLVPRDSPVCGGGSLSEDEYNMPLHLMAVFVVLAQSSFACAFPLMARKFPRLRIPPNFLFFARHFGTGVLIATAFVHLLPTAFLSLTDPCLPPVWSEEYPAMAGAIAMAAVFLVTIVEMIFTKGLCGEHYNPDNHAEATLENGTSPYQTRGMSDRKGNGGMQPGLDGGFVGELAEGGQRHLSPGFGMAGRRRSRGHSIGLELQRFSADMNQMHRGVSIQQVLHENGDSGASSPISLKPLTKQFTKPELTEEQQHKKALLQCFLLEMGILFHSLFIGMAISVTVGPPFIVLLIAILFHQTFEGLALGSRIAVLNWKEGAVKPWLMALAYGLTTPIGQAIGLATHTLYSPESMTGLLMVGIMNAISSGLLVFAGLVELLAEDFLSDESWHTLQGNQRVLACIYVFFGAFGMALVGAWA